MLVLLTIFPNSPRGPPSYISKPLMIGGCRGIPMILAFIFIHKRCQRPHPEPLTYQKKQPRRAALSAARSTAELRYQANVTADNSSLNLRMLSSIFCFVFGDGLR